MPRRQPNWVVRGCCCVRAFIYLSILSTPCWVVRGLGRAFLYLSMHPFGVSSLVVRGRGPRRQAKQAHGTERGPRSQGSTPGTGGSSCGRDGYPHDAICRSGDQAGGAVGGSRRQRRGACRARGACVTGEGRSEARRCRPHGLLRGLRHERRHVGRAAWSKYLGLAAAHLGPPACPGRPAFRRMACRGEAAAAL